MYYTVVGWFKLAIIDDELIVYTVLGIKFRNLFRWFNGLNDSGGVGNPNYND